MSQLPRGQVRARGAVQVFARSAAATAASTDATHCEEAEDDAGKDADSLSRRDRGRRHHVPSVQGWQVLREVAVLFLLATGERYGDAAHERGLPSKGEVQGRGAEEEGLQIPLQGSREDAALRRCEMGSSRIARFRSTQGNQTSCRGTPSRTTQRWVTILRCRAHCASVI